MNSLPLISHHLFVAAVASDDHGCTHQMPNEDSNRRVATVVSERATPIAPTATCSPDKTGAVGAARSARAVPLEVLAEAKAMAGAAARRFRTMRTANGI